jgi:hypothetical protein
MRPKGLDVLEGPFDTEKPLGAHRREASSDAEKEGDRRHREDREAKAEGMRPWLA